MINHLLASYKPEDADGVQSMSKDLLGDSLKGMLEAELEEYLCYSKCDYKRKETDNRRNRYGKKTMISLIGDINLDIQRDHDGESERQIVKKYQADISSVGDQVLSMYAKDMTTRDITEHLHGVNGVEAALAMISKMTDRILPIARSGRTARFPESMPSFSWTLSTTTSGRTMPCLKKPCT